MENLVIIGMECGRCAVRVKRSLEKAGAKNVDVNYKESIARFDYDGDIEDMKFAIFDAGYEAE
jgi:copper chaperone CopZ